MPCAQWPLDVPGRPVTARTDRRNWLMPEQSGRPGMDARSWRQRLPDRCRPRSGRGSIGLRPSTNAQQKASEGSLCSSGLCALQCHHSRR
jgi:hypothetical protein